MRVRRCHLLALLVLIAVALLAGCGGGHKPARHKAAPHAASTVPAAAVACPPGRSYMGCSVTAQAEQGKQLLRRAGLTPPLTTATPTGGLFPDVYEGQGAPNWQAVKDWQLGHHWRVAAIFKMGEYREDFQAVRNASETLRLGFWRSGYWFVRANLGCQGEANAITAEAHKLGILIVSLDLEVPEARGYGACLTPILRLRHFIVVEYTSPGSNPGGLDPGDPIWLATFGSSIFPACSSVSCHPVAWQCSDGVFGCVTDIPGVGRDDVNVDLGITSLGAPPPDPFAVFPKTVYRFGRDHASEYRTAKLWHDAGCRDPVRREVCKSTHYHLQLLLGRIYFVAFHQPVHGHWVNLKHPRWAFPSKQQPLGSRAALIRADLRQR